MNEKGIMKEEFIGMKVRIEKCTDPSLQGMEGRIIDETKNMMVIESRKGIKRVAKKIATFNIGGFIIDGRKISYRPEDRIRKIK